MGFDEDGIARMLALEDPDALAALFREARAVKLAECGPGIAVRGLVEAGNVCAKDCLYCGIRRSNARVLRYTMSMAELVAAAETARRIGYASIVLQGGELESEANTRRVEEFLARIAPLGLGVTLSLGEQEPAVYRRWREAGAARYLLRIETSDPELYSRLHPPTCSFSRRRDCLVRLRELGYQVGTGVMCALPGQTTRQLARDVLFFREIDADMIGMGPYIPHPDTPLAAADTGLTDEARLRLGLKLIAVTRLVLRDVNIAASTALQALADDGRERGILAGANVLMPNITPAGYRASYRLYRNKPGGGEDDAAVRVDLDRRLAKIGESALYGRSGDSRHYVRRVDIPGREA